LPKAKWVGTAFFLLPLARGEAEALRTTAEDRQREAGDHASQGYHHQPALPRGVVLMTFISLPGITCWGYPLSQRVCSFPVFLRPFKHDVPAYHRFLRRPQLLTRV